VIFKDGGQPGVSTTVYLVPSHDVSCVVLTNRSDNYDFVTGRTDSTNLALKLVPHEGRLVGRVLATAEKPGTMLPYVLSLVRVRQSL
jgi:hypothetical protein